MNPHEIATGYTADVSAYLDFTFYDPIYYYDEEEKFPSSKEQLGLWLGPTINCGDAMTYYILTENNQVIARSTVRPANDPATQNHRRNRPFIDEGGKKAPGFFGKLFGKSDSDDSDFVPMPSSANPKDGPGPLVATGMELLGVNNEGAAYGAPTIKPDDLVGYTFIKEYAGMPQRAEVKEMIDEDEGKVLIEFVNGGEELMNYNDLINYYNAKYDEGEHLWTFDKILDHRKVKGGQYEVRVHWDTGESTWEPMKVIKADDKITLAAYARE